MALLCPGASSVNYNVMSLKYICLSCLSLLLFLSSWFGKKALKVATKEGEEEAWSKQTEIYPAKTPLPPKIKTVTFPYDQDIVCSLQYR